jgi:uncharacterized damage-inducible protein DinB
MDLLDRLLGHDAWTTTQILQRCCEITTDQLVQEFDIGHRALLPTIEHMIGNVEIWTALMTGTIDQYMRPASTTDVDALLRWHTTAYAQFAALARQIRDTDKINDLWMDMLDNPPKQKTYGGAILHVITHNMHHRGELLHILARLGLKDLPEGDLMGWDTQHG